VTGLAFDAILPGTHKAFTGLMTALHRPSNQLGTGLATIPDVAYRYLSVPES
jgi:hypothetical protein